MSQNLIRDQFREQRNGTKTHFLIPKSVTFRTCIEPFANLKRTSISNFTKENPARGSYLLLRTVDYPIIRAGVMLLVEDHNGDVTVCFLYEHVCAGNTVEANLQVGTVFVLKEPWLAPSTGSNSLIVVGSPSDFVKVGRKHILFQEVALIGWERRSLKGCLQVEPRTAEDWRSAGNGFFKSASYDNAIESYLVALDLCTLPERRLVLNLNLAAAYLTTGYYERTLDYTSDVLEVEPQNEKALFRMARAQYELRNFVEAERIFTELVLIHSTNRNARLELNRCSERIRESLGCVNVLHLHSKSVNTPGSPIDFGCYVGNVKVLPVLGKGRGVIANCDIQCGTLILAEKALVASLANDNTDGVGAVVLAKLLVQALFRNPLHVGEVLYNMTANNEDWDKQKRVVCDEDRPLIEYDRILQIVNMNSFSLSSDCEGATALSIRRALFPFASFFNHSCTSNSTFEIFNDVIAIRTLTDISEGEEITISYVSNVATFYEKKTLLKSYGFCCTCAVCKMDREELSAVHDQRDDLLATMKILFVNSSTPNYNDSISKNDKSMQLKLTDIVTKLENTFSNRKEYRVHLFRAYLLLAQTVERQGPEYRFEFLKIIDSGLRTVGLSVKALLRSAADKGASLPKNALICKLLFQYASVCSRAELSYNRLDQVNNWVKVLLMLEHLFTGGDFNVLRERFKSSLLMSAVLENAVM